MIGPKQRTFYVNNVGDMPVEFQTAVYRFGHATVRPSYRMNEKQGPGQTARYVYIFDAANANAGITHGHAGDPDDMSGGFPGSARVIGWRSFFPVQRKGNVVTDDFLKTKLTRPKLCSPLAELPLGVIRADDGPVSLAQRNLLRAITWQLPSGQDVARKMGFTPLAPGDLTALHGLGANLEKSTPLYFYALKEAEVFAGGQHLGPMGGRIVSEVFVGLLENDPNCFLNAKPDFKPTLGRNPGHDFDMTDLLHIAGVDVER